LIVTGVWIVIKNKKIIGITLIAVLLLIIISLRIFFIISPEEPMENEENNELIEEIIIYENNHSIYNVTDPKIIAERFADALNASPIKYKSLLFEYGSRKTIEYNLQNDSSIRIHYDLLKNKEIIITEMFLVQSSLQEKNGTFDAEFAKKKVLDFVNDFLLKYGVKLGENYSIFVTPWPQNQNWKVEIYQLYQEEILNGSGFQAIVRGDNGEISTMDIYDWLDPNSPILENISIDECRIKIFNEIEEDNFNITDPSSGKTHSIKINITDIKFEGYNTLWGRLGYKFEINYQINETSTCSYQYIFNVENGKKIFWRSESEGAARSTSYYNNLI
jgi:hypothetical protein